MRQNSSGNQREREKQTKLRKGCRRDADCSSATREFDRQRIGKLQCTKKGWTGGHERAQARRAEQNQSVGQAECQP